MSWHRFCKEWEKMDEFASYQSFAQVYDEFMDQTPYRLWGENIRQYLRKYKVKDLSLIHI